MSFLEDVFLQDETNEAQELERIIECDEINDRPASRSDSDDSSEKEDEAEEEKRRVDPTTNKTKRLVKNPRVILNPARLTGPRGIQVIPEHFKNFQFRGKGHEKEDLDLVMKKLEHWAYRLYPKFKFEDCLKKIEILGRKKLVMVHLQKIRTDQFLSEETIVQKDSSDDENLTEEPKPVDEFDKLLQQQIELARSTPISSVKKRLDSTVNERSLIMPKATCSPSISDEQRDRMLKSRKLAEEKRLARLLNSSSTNSNRENDLNNSDITSVIANNGLPDNKKQAIDSQTVKNINTENLEVEGVKRKHNKSNIIDSSDEEDDIVIMNESITVDVHKSLENVYNRSEKLDKLTVSERKENDIDIEDAELHPVLMNESVKNNSTENIENEKDYVKQRLETSNKDLNNSKLKKNDINNKNVIENHDVNHQLITDNELIVKEINHLKKVNKSDNGNELQKMSTAQVEYTNNTDLNNERCQEKTIARNVEDMMDVDFSDDF